MKKTAFTLLLSLSLAMTAQAETKKQTDNSATLDMLVVAKATGMCGAYFQLVNFQQSKKIAGGDELVTGFLTAEATRLGHTLDSFMAQCPEVVKRYNINMELLGLAP